MLAGWLAVWLSGFEENDIKSLKVRNRKMNNAKAQNHEHNKKLWSTLAYLKLIL